jgi:hypothetical protein
MLISKVAHDAIRGNRRARTEEGNEVAPLARATRALRRREGSGQVPFLLAERAHSESARSMRAVKGSPTTPLKKGIEK